MRSTLLLYLTAISLQAQQPQTLTPLDRELLLEKLNEVQSEAEGQVNTRFSAALNAFKSAMASNDNAHDLYLKCVEKVRFEDANNKAVDFRNWKRQHRESTDSPAFRLALRHQLNWLTLMLEASAKPTEIQTLTPRIISALNAIFSDAEKLSVQQEVLDRPVTSSVFASAYSVSDIKTQFPATPTSIAPLYENIILPPLREESKLSELQKAWDHRILLEGTRLEKWGRLGTLPGTKPPAFEKWLIDGRANLLWLREVDCFKLGDERRAAKVMIDIIKANISHPKAPAWITEFTSLMSEETQPTQPTEPTQPAGTPETKATPSTQ